MKLYSAHNIDNGDDNDRNDTKLKKDGQGRAWVHSAM